MTEKSNLAIFICGGINCQQRGNDGIAKEIASRIVAEGLETKIDIRRMFCFRMCANGPNIMLFPDGDIYNSVTSEALDDILLPIFARAQEIQQ